LPDFLFGLFIVVQGIIGRACDNSAFKPQFCTTIIPLKQIKYFSCDASVFAKQKAEK